MIFPLLEITELGYRHRVKIKHEFPTGWASWCLTVKNLPSTARDLGSVLGPGRSPGEGNGSRLQYSCLENPVDGGAWGAAVHRVAQSQTQLKQLSTYTNYFESRKNDSINFIDMFVSLESFI